MTLPPRIAPGERIVVLRALGIGDLLTALPALRALARTYAHAHITLVAPAALDPLVRLARLPFFVAEAPLDAPPPRELRRPALAVNLHGRGPESVEWLLALDPGALVSHCPPRPRVAESADAHSSVPLPPWRDGVHEVERWCALLTEYGLPSDPSDLRLDPATLPPSPREGCTLLHSGANVGSRRWPFSRWARVARWEAEHGGDVVLTGSAKERPRALAIARAAGLPDSCVLAGRTDLLSLAALVAGADHVVSADTGVQHLATALGTPSVVLFGPVPPREWGPSIDLERHIALWGGIESDPRSSTPAEGLLRIRVADVIDALERLLVAAV